MRIFIRSLAVAVFLATVPLTSSAAVVVSVGFAPPALPAYVLPPMPGPGYLWLPGYWAWRATGYYWVPGFWSRAPAPGLLWTPGYWGWAGGAYCWHAGYWGPHVGFYGGINYGFGYGGVGYRGGYWRGGRFIANRAVMHAGPVNRVSFNGGVGGIVARASPAELRAAREQQVSASHEQLQHEERAAHDNAMRASNNHGAPRRAGIEPQPAPSHGSSLMAHTPRQVGAGAARPAPGSHGRERPPSAGHVAHGSAPRPERYASARGTAAARHGGAEHAEHDGGHAGGRGGHAHRR
jgi:hypothetical protein